MHIKKKRFVAPHVISETSLILERSILAGSVLDNMEYIVSTGQEVESIDLGGTGNSYSNYWEE